MNLPTYMNPNTQHQLWSRWVFTIHEHGRSVPRKDVEYNAAKWLAQGFGRAGKVRVVRTIRGWRIECVVEGPPAHDRAFVRSVEEQFASVFVQRGWGMGATSMVRAKVLAGDKQDGKPRDQMVEMPGIIEV